jgi:hypothetical protein
MSCVVADGLEWLDSAYNFEKITSNEGKNLLTCTHQRSTGDSDSRASTAVRTQINIRCYAVMAVKFGALGRGKTVVE